MPTGTGDPRGRADDALELGGRVTDDACRDDIARGGREHVRREPGDRVDAAGVVVQPDGQGVQRAVSARRELAERGRFGAALRRTQRRAQPLAPDPERATLVPQQVAVAPDRPVARPWSGTTRHATPVPAARLTPQPIESAPAWLVTASSQTHTSAARIASPMRLARDRAWAGSTGAVVIPSTARSTAGRPSDAQPDSTAAATRSSLAVSRLTPSTSTSLSRIDDRTRIADWPPSTARSRSAVVVSPTPARSAATAISSAVIRPAAGSRRRTPRP